jgi:hypothetical protein
MGALPAVCRIGYVAAGLLQHCVPGDGKQRQHTYQAAC